MNRAGPLNEPAFKGLVREVLEEVTKPQFATARRETQQQFEQFKTDILSAIRSMLQEFKNDIAAMKDEIISELQATREEATIDKSIHRRVVDLEDDVAQLRKIHPEGTHSSTS